MNSIGTIIKYERLKQNMSQEALCEGICSNTYLSKIENGLDNPNEEILTHLVDALGYTYRTEGLEEFLDLESDLWKRYETMDKRPFTFSEEHLLLLDSLYMSKVSASVIILKALENVFNDQELDVLFTEVIDSSKLPSSLRYRYYTILCMDNPKLSLNDLEISNYSDDKGYLLYFKASTLFLNGDYQKAIEVSRRAYDIFSNRGYVNWMIQASFIEASSTSNLNNLDGFIEISKRISNLNEGLRIKDTATDYFLNYNLGSTYLVLNKFDLSKKHLLKSLDYDSGSLDSTYEKLSLLYLFERDFKNAKVYIDKMNSEYNSKKLLLYMLETENDLKSKEYISLLEECYNNELDRHHGRSMLFGTLLFDAYKSTYQYPKALKLMEQSTFLIKPLYFEK